MNFPWLTQTRIRHITSGGALQCQLWHCTLMTLSWQENYCCSAGGGVQILRVSVLMLHLGARRLQMWERRRDTRSCHVSLSSSTQICVEYVNTPQTSQTKFKKIGIQDTPKALWWSPLLELHTPDFSFPALLRETRDCENYRVASPKWQGTCQQRSPQ